ncbi:GDP-mannose 4,6-dehydratase [Paenibacillus sp. HWE-109]|uniref:GDP-mannose 4,6-dehydratase n=1 Tax=Paenibacillus sp. HWE-109 TaxID=1306526 RepID=UPI001EE067B1|nr:GDP-mannose 4,6-dehydratase [Paenibacillus sp. HWE-109]UKS24987.1 GDP-mannose 4,6-dehydratase [Paenibacillus sp. HWE-109]
MKALITGISGFVGTYLSEKLLEYNYEVIGLSRSCPTSKYINCIPCDIQDSLKVEQVIKSCQPDEIYHLAGSGFIPLSYEKPIETYNTIVNGTLNLYEVVRKLDLDTKILYVSSAEVYGDGRGIAFNENDILRPNNPYAGAKACADLISEQYAKTYDMKILRARAFNHTGPRQTSEFVCSNFAKQISEMERVGRDTIRVGNIDVKRDFLDVRDVVNAYFLIMKLGISGEVYNVSSNNGVSIHELLNTLIAISNIKYPKIEIDDNKVREKEASVRIGDNTKLRCHTGWLPKYDLKDTMKDLLDYWRNRKISF